MPRTRPIGKTGGRQKGVLNKATKAIKEIAQPHTEEAISTLLRIMRDGKYPAQARVAAAGMLLDRGWGKPHQSISADVQNEHRLVARVPEPMDRAEWEEFLKYKRNEKPLETAPLKFANLLSHGPEWDRFKQQQAKLIEAKPNGSKTPLPKPSSS